MRTSLGDKGSRRPVFVGPHSSVSFASRSWSEFETIPYLASGREEAESNNFEICQSILFFLTKPALKKNYFTVPDISGGFLRA